MHEFETKNIDFSKSKNLFFNIWYIFIYSCKNLKFSLNLFVTIFVVKTKQK